MKRMRLLILVFAVTILVQCSKDKNDNAANLTKGLLAVFKMNNDFEDSTGNINLGYRQFQAGIFRPSLVERNDR
jgi:hypothetical protein